MANKHAQLSVATNTQTLLWQTSSGFSPDPAISGQVFRAGRAGDPVPIVVVNHDATNAVFVGGSNVTTSTGAKLAAGGTLTYQVVGNDSLYAQSASAAVSVGVTVALRKDSCGFRVRVAEVRLLPPRQPIRSARRQRDPVDVDRFQDNLRAAVAVRPAVSDDQLHRLAGLAMDKLASARVLYP